MESETETHSTPTSKKVALMSVFTALVYITTSISVPMPSPLGVWHMGNLVGFLAAILCGPNIGAFVCGVGAGLFDLWNPLWGSRFIIYFPGTILIRGSMGYLIGRIAYGRTDYVKYSIAAVLFGHVWKNVGYFLYDYMLYGAAAFLDLTSLSVKSVFEVILTLAVLAAVRRKIGVTYLIEEQR
jgi:uncharacterized membrane protein